MKLLLATLCLNEMEHLEALVAQHLNWAGVELSWVFVEAADALYAAANPSLVSPDGLSTDGTTDFLRGLAARDGCVTYVPHGLARHPDPAQGKCAARQRYLEVALALRPDYVWVLDSDEFLSRGDQSRVLAALRGCRDGLALQQRHAWAPPGSGVAPFELEVVGGYWDVPHPRGFRWRRGLRYGRNHNLPDGVRVQTLARGVAPDCVHLGFASSLRSRAAKHAYYRARGEGKGDGRQRHVEARAAWEAWCPGDPLPGGACVVPWRAAIPEVFREGEACASA